MKDLPQPIQHRDLAIASVRTCLVKYATFSGRAPRREFWYFILFLIVAQIGFIVLNLAIFDPVVVSLPNGEMRRYYDNGPLGRIFLLAMMIPLLAVGWRRLHDRNLSGWWLLLPSVLQIILMVEFFAHIFGVSAVLQMLRGLGALSYTFSGSNIGLLATIVLAAHILLLVTLARRGTRGPNRFGPDPLEGVA